MGTVNIIEEILSLRQRVQGLEVALQQQAPPNKVGFPIDGREVLVVTVAGEFFVDGEATTDPDRIIEAFGRWARTRLTEPPAARLTGFGPSGGSA